MEAADVAPEVVWQEPAKPSPRVTLVAQLVTFKLEAHWLVSWAGRELVADAIPAAVVKRVADPVVEPAVVNCMLMSGSMSRRRLITVDAESV